MARVWQAERNAAIWALLDAGETPAAAALKLGLTRSTVAGVLRRGQRQPKHASPFYNEAWAREAVALADDLGVRRAAAQLGLDAAQLCRWRQRLRRYESGAENTTAIAKLD
jgi:2-hydroxychromene-2-carboxylate isomerase